MFNGRSIVGIMWINGSLIKSLYSCTHYHGVSTIVRQATKMCCFSRAHPGILWLTGAAFCPLVLTTMSHTISSCQISPVSPGRVPIHIVPVSVSRHGQLLGRVTPHHSWLQGSVVVRDLVVLQLDGSLWMPSDVFVFLFFFQLGP